MPLPGDLPPVVLKRPCCLRFSDFRAAGTEAPLDSFGALALQPAFFFDLRVGAAAGPASAAPRAPITASSASLRTSAAISVTNASIRSRIALSSRGGCHGGVGTAMPVGPGGKAGDGVELAHWRATDQCCRVAGPPSRDGALQADALCAISSDESAACLGGGGGAGVQRESRPPKQIPRVLSRSEAFPCSALRS